MTAKYNPALWGAVTHEHVSEFIMSHLRYGPAVSRLLASIRRKQAHTA